LSTLAPESPPDGGWARVSSRLDARRFRRRHGRAWLAAAAALVLAVALPWQLPRVPDASPSATSGAATTAAAAGEDALQRLYAESGQLETLLQLARDDRVSSGTAAILASELDARIASIDAALMQPDLPPPRQLRLWQDRVDALRSAAGFEGTRRWLVAQGARYDAGLVQID
jgi:hypothetical protein